jgi:hypothetical protein
MEAAIGPSSGGCSQLALHLVELLDLGPRFIPVWPPVTKKGFNFTRIRALSSPEKSSFWRGMGLLLRGLSQYLRSSGASLRYQSRFSKRRPWGSEMPSPVHSLYSM